MELEQRGRGLILTNLDLHEEALITAKQIRIPDDFEASCAWITKFKKRKNLHV